MVMQFGDKQLRKLVGLANSFCDKSIKINNLTNNNNIVKQIKTNKIKDLCVKKLYFTLTFTIRHRDIFSDTNSNNIFSSKQTDTERQRRK